jgi:acetyl-CoA C-acetyltransferase
VTDAAITSTARTGLAKSWTGALNVDGGAIAIGLPYGMSGARLVSHALLEGKRRRIRYAVVALGVCGGQGAAALLEIC